MRIQNGENPQKRETNGGSFMVLELDALSRRLKTFLQAWSFLEALEENKYIAIYDPKMSFLTCKFFLSFLLSET